MPNALATPWAGGCARVTAGPKRPHLGVCPGPNIPLQGRQGSWGCTTGSPGESGLVSSPEVRREGREPLPDHAGVSPLLSPSGGEKGLRGSGAGTIGVPLEGTRRVGGLLGVAGRLSETRPDSPGEPVVQPRDPCLSWRGILGPGHTPR